MPKILINERNKKDILYIIDSWQGKLSWKLLCEHVTKEFNLSSYISRHTLLEYDDIKLAFDARKMNLKGKSRTSIEANEFELQKAYDRIDRLEAQVARLGAEKLAITEQFVRWQHNLYRMGIDMDSLQREINRPLLSVERRGTNRRTR